MFVNIDFFHCLFSKHVLILKIQKLKWSVVGSNKCIGVDQLMMNLQGYSLCGYDKSSDYPVGTALQGSTVGQESAFSKKLSCMLVGLLAALWFEASLVPRAASACSFPVSWCYRRVASDGIGASQLVLASVPALTARQAADSPLTTEGALVSGT